MTYDELLKEYNSLPLDYKREVEDFIGYLSQKFKKTQKGKLVKQTPDFAKGKVRMTPDVDTHVEEDEKIRSFVADSGSFDFWKNDLEDIYQDYIPKSMKLKLVILFLCLFLLPS